MFADISEVKCEGMGLRVNTSEGGLTHMFTLPTWQSTLGRYYFKLIAAL
jgi:hypothetical protein